jgi:hypothetical protein
VRTRLPWNVKINDSGKLVTYTMVRTMVHVYVCTVRTYYNVMSQLSDWKRAHMCYENYVCFGRIHGSQLREGANAGQHTYTLATALTPLPQTALQCLRACTYVRTYAPFYLVPTIMLCRNFLIGKGYCNTHQVHVYVRTYVQQALVRVQAHMLARIVVESCAADIAVELEPQYTVMSSMLITPTSFPVALSACISSRF